MADRGRVRPGDTVLLDSPFHSTPFVHSPDDRRPDMSEEVGRWFLEKKVKCVGWGDGIAIENHVQGCIACHELMLGNDILLLEVVCNIDQLRAETFMITFTPVAHSRSGLLSGPGGGGGRHPGSLARISHQAAPEIVRNHLFLMRYRSSSRAQNKQTVLGMPWLVFFPPARTCSLDRRNRYVLRSRARAGEKKSCAMIMPPG